MRYRVLAINPGSTSTKIAVFDDETPVFTKTLRHDAKEIEKFGGVIEQYEYRKGLVLEAMAENDVPADTLEAVVGRGGLVRSVPGGAWKVNEKMKAELKDPSIWGRIHASNLGAFIADSIASELNIPAFIVDPVTVDEFEDIARVSGIKEIERKSLFHALNIRFTARHAAKEIGKPFEECNMIPVHMGGGITVGAIKQGRVVDVNNALLGMGPFSPQRAGALPIGDLIEMCYSGDWTKKDLQTYLTKKAGLISYLGNDDGVWVEKQIREGNKEVKFIHDAMCYQISKDIGGFASVLEGKVDCIFLTGGLAYNPFLVEEIRRRTAFIAQLLVYPGEKEMEALSQGGIRVLKGLDEAGEY